MRWRVPHRLSVVLAFLFVLRCAFLAAQVPGEAAAREEAGAVGVKLFDTGASSPVPLPGRALSATGKWARLPDDETDHSFRGDAVLANDRLGVVLRRNGRGAEVYSGGPDGFSMRAVLAPAGDGPGGRLESVAIVENSPAAVAVDATFQATGGRTRRVRYELEMGQGFVRTEALEGATGLRVEAPCRFVVLPDFFADDVVVDAARIPVARAELPSENFLLHMLPGGDAIVMSVSSSRQQDARITLAGPGTERVVDQSEIPYGKDGKIWVAVISGRDVWHLRNVAEGDAGRVLRLDWKAPYPAQWRVDWSRDDDLTGSWEMIVEHRNGEFEKHGWFGRPTRIPPDRKRWTTVLGRFEYPCWVDRDGWGRLQPLAKKVRFRGPALIYPINRVGNTPLDEFTVVDFVRATLGVGPCEYILDVEGQGAEMKGRATCATRDTLNPIYAAGQQRYKRAEIERALDEVLIFVKHIRGRIDAYRAFGHDVLGYLDEQKKAHPELADFVAEMESLTRTIDDRVERRKPLIKTTQYVADLTEQFRATLMDYEGPDALAKCKAVTGAIVVVGGNQDELVGECRMAVKVLRQRAGLAMAIDPRAAPVAKEIRRRTREILRNPTTYEAARH